MSVREGRVFFARETAGGPHAHTNRSTHTQLEIEDLAQAGNQYAKEAGGIAKTLAKLTESLEAAKVRRGMTKG